MINFIFCRVFCLCLLDPSRPIFVLSLSLKLYMAQLFYLFYLQVLISFSVFLVLDSDTSVTGFPDCAGLQLESLI